MTGIQVETRVLTETAKVIRDLNTKLNMDLAQCNKEMDALQNTFQSEASTTIRAAMNKLKPTFDEYQGVIESYAKFLDNTAERYRVTEIAVTKNATEVDNTGQFKK